jgi:hypothetical protein
MSGPGFLWRCTDIGTRTILAIQLDRDVPNWYSGPPYIAKEVVFDEYDIVDCYLTQDEAIEASLDAVETSGHPGFPHEVVTHMMDARWRESEARYPHKGVLRFDRRRTDAKFSTHTQAGKTARIGSLNCTCRSCGSTKKCPSELSSRSRLQRQPISALEPISGKLPGLSI